MTIQELRKLYDAQPFRPFDMYLADGRKIPVKHPEFAALSPRGDTVVVYQTDGSFDIVDLFLITTLRVNGRKPLRGRRSRTDRRR